MTLHTNEELSAREETELNGSPSGPMNNHENARMSSNHNA
jgi:hypothetical protein